MSRGAGLLLAFDYGLRRIGVATGNRLTKTATPLTTLHLGRDLPWPEIDALLGAWRPDLIVVGRPGPETDPALLGAIDDFVATLKSRYDIAVASVDESNTSTAAEADYRAGRSSGHYNRRLRKGRIDQHAACLIAEQWMNQALDRD
jgi:putative Holliday junction resolvase